MTDREEQTMQDNDEPTTPLWEVPSKSVASTLAAMLIFDSIREGNEFEIPSLGITITKEDLQDPDEELPKEEQQKDEPPEKLAKWYFLRSFRDYIRHISSRN